MAPSPAKASVKRVLFGKHSQRKRSRGHASSSSCNDGLDGGEDFPPFSMVDFTEDTDERRSEVIQTLSVYAFLRTFSYALHLSPFDVETFILSLHPQKSLTSNPLLTAIHTSLLRVCCMFYATDLGTWPNLDWTLMDSFTWPCYILPLLKLARKRIVVEATGSQTKDKNNTGKENDEIFIDTFEYKQLQSAISLILSKGHYFKLSIYEKTSILNCIIAIFMKHPSFLNMIEERAKIDSKNNARNTIEASPWSILEGEDGTVENCILCDEGGDLVCCDFCPVGYHKECLNENPKAFDGSWSCYECSIPDPAKGRARMNFLGVTPTIKMKIVGRFPLLFILDRPGQTDATAYILTPAQVAQSMQKTKSNSALAPMFNEYSQSLGQFIYLNEQTRQERENSQKRLEVLHNLSLQTAIEADDDKGDSATGSKSGANKPVVTERDDLGSSIEVEAPPLDFTHVKDIPAVTYKDMCLMTTHHFIDLEVLADRYLPENYTNHYVGNRPVGPGYFPSSRVHQRPFIDPLYNICHKLYSKPDILLTTKDASAILWPIYDQRTLKQSKSYLSDHKDSKNHDFALLSICRLLEIIYTLTLPLTGKLFNENPFTKDSFHVQLYRVKTLQQLKKLVIRFVDSLSPFVLNPLFFLPVDELRDKTIGSARSLQTRVFGIKPSFVRVDQFQQLGTSIRRKSSKANFDPIDAERAKLLEGPLSYFKEDPHFFTGRRICGTDNVCRLPRKLLRRLARNGGVALLPNFAYKANKMYASPPFFQNWCGRVQQCKTTYDLALLLRYFEQGVQEAMTGLNTRNHNLVIKSKVGYTEDEFSKESRQKDVMTNIISITSDHTQLRTVKLVKEGKLPAESLLSLPPEARTINTDDLAYYNTMNTSTLKDDETLGKSINMQNWKDYFLRRWMESITKKSEDRTRNKAFLSLQKFAHDILEIMIQNNNMNEELYTVANDVLTIYKNAKENVKDEIVGTLISSKLASPEAATIIASSLINRAINGAIEIVKYTNSIGSSKGSTSSNNETNNDIMRIEKQTVKLSVSCFDRLFDSFQMQVFKNKKPSTFITIEENYNAITISPQHSNLIDRSLCVLDTLGADIESYIPQVGDEVIYYASGHKDYLDLYLDDAPLLLSAKRRGLVKKKKQSKYAERVPCRVLSIDYEFPVIAKGSSADKHAVLCLLQLGTLGPGHKERQIFLLYRPGHTCGEFLVSKERMQTCLLRQFQPGNSFSMVYDGGQRYEGKVLELAKDDDLFPVWAGAKVFWEESGVDYLNEWELDPPAATNEADKVNNGKTLHDNTDSVEDFVLDIIDHLLTEAITKSKSYASLVHDRSVLETKITEIKAHAEKEIVMINQMLHQIAVNLMKVADFDLFLYEVTNDIAPKYNQIIPVSMYLDLMRSRASNNYYRQPQAFLGDARTIYVNCLRYNTDVALITLKAGEFYRTVYTSIKESFPKEKLFDYLQFEKVFGDRGSVQSLIEKLEYYY